VAEGARKLFLRHYGEGRFGGFSDVDGTVTFYTRVRSLTEPESAVLDVGCGRGSYANDPVRMRRDLRTLKGSCRSVIGIDVDPDASSNPSVDEFRLITGTEWPVDEGSIDVCVADWVVEHVGDPRQFFDQCRRVVRPGGYLCVRTMNLQSYVGLASRALPNSLHREFLDKLRVRDRRDVFETAYRCNTTGLLRAFMEGAGFTSHVYAHNPEPTYLHFSPALYRLGVWYQRHAPRSLGVSLYAFGRRRAGVATASAQRGTWPSAPFESAGSLAGD